MTATAAANAVFPNMTVAIRPARAEDAEAILKMIRALAVFQDVGDRVKVKADQLRRDGFGANPKFEALIAENEGKAVGLAIFETHYSSWEGASSLQITDLFVDESVRGSGVGFRLVLEVGRIARERECVALRMNMVHANPSRTSLDRMGFVHQDDLLHYRLDGKGLKKLVEMDR